MDLSTMGCLFQHDLQDLYSAEKQVFEALPKMIGAASSQELRTTFQDHIAAYGTAREFARELGYDDIARSLDITLHEEGNADKDLSRIARGTYFKTGINEFALK